MYFSRGFLGATNFSGGFLYLYYPLRVVSRRKSDVPTYMMAGG